MNLDVTLVRGDPYMPAAFLIHGLGMDKRIWESPDKSRVLGGSFPISFLLNREPGNIETRDARRKLFLGESVNNLTTLFHSLKERKYTVITWSQRRPSAEVEIAVSELRYLTAAYEKYCGSGIVLVCHSRGGLVARKYLAYGDTRVRAMITLASPHMGSGMARWAEYISPLTSLVASLLPYSERGTLTYVVRRVLDFLGSRAVKELLPDSCFFRSLDDARIKGVQYLSIGGKNPTLFTVYRGVVETKDKDDRFIMKSRKIFSVPGIFEKVIPAKLFPDELKQGKGDGLVSTESSKLPWAGEHHDFDLNHAALLFDEGVKKTVVDALCKL